MRRLLIADDDKQLVRTLCDVLQLHGWEAEGVYDGEAAIDAVRRVTYSAVIMDVRMPGISGVAALKIIRAERPDVPVMLMTAYSTRDLIAEAEREGALSIVEKPLDVDAMADRVARSLKRSRPILIVDDSDAQLHVLQRALLARGLVAVTGLTLDAAVRRAEAEAPAAVLLHHSIDNLGPSEAVLAIRSITPAVALILYGAGRRDQAEAAGALHPQVHALLQKPFPIERLLGILERIRPG